MSGGLSGHRLCSSAVEPLVQFQCTAQMAMQLHCVIKQKASVSEKKEFPPSILNKTQYPFRISGNRGYISNRVCFHVVFMTSFVSRSESGRWGLAEFICIFYLIKTRFLSQRQVRWHKLIPPPLYNNPIPKTRTFSRSVSPQRVFPLIEHSVEFT